MIFVLSEKLWFLAPAITLILIVNLLFSTILYKRLKFKGKLFFIVINVLLTFDLINTYLMINEVSDIYLKYSTENVFTKVETKHYGITPEIFIAGNLQNLYISKYLILREYCSIDNKLNDFNSDYNYLGKFFHQYKFDIKTESMMPFNVLNQVKDDEKFNIVTPNGDKAIIYFLSNKKWEFEIHFVLNLEKAQISGDKIKKWEEEILDFIKTLPPLPIGEIKVEFKRKDNVNITVAKITDINMQCEFIDAGINGDKYIKFDTDNPYLRLLYYLVIKIKKT